MEFQPVIDAYPLCCCLIGQHTWIRLYDRPWQNWWRRRIFDCCIYCGTEEPVLT
jgi:hypothetical protein